MTKTVTLDFFKSVADLSNANIQILPVTQDFVPAAKQEWVRTYKYPAGVIAVGHFGNRFAGLFSPLSNVFGKVFRGVKNFIYYDVMVAIAERGARRQLGLTHQTVSEYKGSLIAQRNALATELSLQWHQSNSIHTGHGAPAQVFVKVNAQYANLSREELVAKIDTVNTQLTHANSVTAGSRW